MNKSLTKSIQAVAIPANARAEGMLNRQELAKCLRISTRPVDEWRAERLIPFIKLRKVVIFWWPDVVEHLRENFGVIPNAEKLKPETLKPESGVHGVRRPTAGGTLQ